MPTRPSTDPGLAPIEPYQPPRERAAPTLAQSAAAAFRTDNDVASVGAYLARPAFDPDPGYDVFQDPAFKGTLYQQQHDRAFWSSGSAAETQAIIARIDREEEDRRVLEAAGVPGLALQVLAGALSPTMLLPGGAMVRGARGLSVSRSALSVALAGGAAVAAQEGLLQATQETRSLAESGMNIASGVILGGLLGAGAAGLLGRAERRATERALDAERARLAAEPPEPEVVPGSPADLRAALEAQIADTPAAPAAGAGGSIADLIGRVDEMVRRRAEASPAEGERMPLVPDDGPPVAATVDDLRAATAGMGELPADLSAAVADPRRLELTGYGFDKVPGLRAVIQHLSPTLRTFSRPFVSARRAAADLAEPVLQFEENLVGRATMQGPSIDRLVRLQSNQARIAVTDKIDELYSQMRFGRQVAAPGLRAALEDMTGRGTPGLMSREAFDREIGRAMRRGDQHEVPQVAQAAQFIRARVFEPWKERAIAAGLLPPDVDTKTAESYFQRLYDKGRIAARRSEFVGRIRDWLKADQEAKARAQDRIRGKWEEMGALDTALARMEQQSARMEQRAQRLGAALNERAMEVGRAERRVNALEDRSAMLAQEIADLTDVIDWAKGEIASPGMRDLIANLEGELKDLRRAERLARVSSADLDRAEKEELGTILSGTTRTAAEMLAGRRKLYRAPSFLSFIAKGGGIADEGGEVLASLGGTTRTRPGLISASGLSADEWAERMVEASKGVLQERPEPRDVLDWIDAAARGEDPWWWRATRVDEEKARAGEMALAWEEALARAGAEPPKTVADVGRLLRDEARAEGGGAVTLDDLDARLAEMEAAGAPVPFTGRRAQAEEALFVQQSAVKDLRGTIAAAREAIAPRRGRQATVDLRSDEAQIAARASRGRLGILNDRIARLERHRGMVDAFAADARARQELLRGQVEADIALWQGKSAAEAQAALRRVAKAQGERAPDAPRLAAADGAVDAAVRSILASDRARPDAELEGLAGDIVNRILGSPDGRLPYDAPAGGPTIGMRERGAPRGALAARDFMIPDELIEPFLVSSAEEVVAAHVRTVIPDVLLAERFGDVEMTTAFKALDEEAHRLAMAAPDEAARARIERQRQGAIQDLAAMRDRVRGVYGWSSDALMQQAGRVGNAIKAGNTLLSMGGAALSSISDLAGPVFRHGFGTVLNDGWRPFLAMLTDRSEASPWRQAARQYRAMGIATEMVLASRHRGFAEITDVYRPGTAAERGLQWAADRFQMLNLLAPWTDFGKTMAAVVSGNEVLRAAKAVAENAPTPRQLRNLASAGIDRQMAARIWREFQAGGAVVDGVHLPNTVDWADRGAREAFEGAVAREVDIAIITPGQEKPLWLSNPILSVFGQFKAFVASATERILIAGLQRRDAETLQGAIGAVALGMLSYRLYALASGQEVSARPQDWVKEGISRSGLLGWIEEGNAISAKLSRGSADVYRLIGADRPLTRFASRSTVDALLGPTVGKIVALSQVTGAAGAGEWTESDTHRLRTLVAGQNLFYLRGLFDALERGANGTFGVPPPGQR